MTDRDHFAAAALTGLLSQGDDGSFSEDSYVRAAYRWADAMLRCRAGGDCPGPDNAPNLDASPEAKADLPDERPPNAVSANGETPCAASRDGSGTGNTQEPVAWAVMVDGRRMYVSWCKEMCEDEAFYHRHPCGDSVLVVPLYRHPHFTLTDAERDAIDEAAVWYEGVDDDERCRGIAATLRGLLERLGGVK